MTLHSFPLCLLSPPESHIFTPGLKVGKIVVTPSVVPPPTFFCPNCTARARRAREKRGRAVEVPWLFLVMIFFPLCSLCRKRAPSMGECPFTGDLLFHPAFPHDSFGKSRLLRWISYPSFFVGNADFFLIPPRPVWSQFPSKASGIFSALRPPADRPSDGCAPHLIRRSA